MGLEPLLAANFTVGLALLALAAWILFLDPRATVHRIVSLFLFLRGMYTLLGQGIILGSEQPDFWFALRGYFGIATPFALIDLFVVYLWRQRSPRRTAIRAANLGLLLVCLGVYAADHTAVAVLGPAGITLGPLAFVPVLGFTLSGAMAVWFAFVAPRAATRAQRRFHSILSLAFATFALADGMLPYSSLLTGGVRRLYPPDASLAVSTLSSIYLLAAPLALVAVLMLVLQVGRRSATHRNWVIGVAAFTALVSLTAGLVQPDEGSSNTSRDWFFFLLLGVARLAFPALIAYGVARQSSSDAVFELDYKLRITLRRGSLGGFLVAAYFAVSQITTEVMKDIEAFRSFGPFWGQAFGLVAAGVTLVLLHPLGRIADRMAQATFPSGQPLSKMDADERLKLYEEQVQIAWADGALTRKERLLLDRLRERLQVSLDAASAAERRALRAPRS